MLTSSCPKGGTHKPILKYLPEFCPPSSKGLFTPAPAEKLSRRKEEPCVFYFINPVFIHYLVKKLEPCPGLTAAIAWVTRKLTMKTPGEKKCWHPVFATDTRVEARSNAGAARQGEKQCFEVLSGPPSMRGNHLLTAQNLSPASPVT